MGRIDVSPVTSDTPYALDVLGSLVEHYHRQAHAGLFEAGFISATSADSTLAWWSRCENSLC